MRRRDDEIIKYLSGEQVEEVIAEAEEVADVLFLRLFLFERM